MNKNIFMTEVYANKQFVQEVLAQICVPQRTEFLQNMPCAI